MSFCSLKLLLIDDDPIFRIGLATLCAQFPDLQVVAEAEDGRELLQRLGELLAQEKADSIAPAPNAAPTPPNLGVDLLILELASGRSAADKMSGLALCQHLNAHYPQVPVLLLSSVTEPALLRAAQQAGVKGYCPKGTAPADLIAAIRQVARGQTYWGQLPALRRKPPELHTQLSPLNPLALLRRNLQQSGLRHIESDIAGVSAELQNPALNALDRAVLCGRQRELRAARWLVNNLLAAPDAQPAPVALAQKQKDSSLPAKIREESEQSSLGAAEAGGLPVRDTAGEISFRALQSELFEACLAKLDSNLPNLTDLALEIDILRAEKKRELLSTVLRQLQEVLDELRFSQVQLPQLTEKRSAIVLDLWQMATVEFFGKYYTLLAGNREIEVVPVLLQDAEIVQSEILDKIPLLVELFSHLLFQTPLRLDSAAYPAGSQEAMLRAEFLLHNLVIQVANAVVQPLLNHFPEVEEIKQGFYDRRWISTRSIEKFRNNLSWKYRREKYIGEPTAIFESRYWLLVLDYRGLAKIDIYAPRRQELGQLKGVRLAVTLVLESRDAVAPRLRETISFLGTGVVYVLTQVIGRGIGLIARGVLQGMGSSWQESKLGKNGPRQKREN
jgi:DNA-binding NarL/FixJ family response regulator